MNKAHLGARFIAALGITDWGISDPSESFFRNLLGNYLQMKGLFAERLRRGHQGLASAQALEDDKFIAGCRNNLGNAYRSLPTGDRGENLKNAIGCYEAALRVRTEDGFPVDWALTRNNLGNAYGNLPAGDRGENLKNAIGCYEAALRVYTRTGSRFCGR